MAAHPQEAGMLTFGRMAVLPESIEYGVMQMFRLAARLVEFCLGSLAGPAALICLSLACDPATAQQAAARLQVQNDGSVGVVSGGADGTYIRIAADLATVLDSADLRVLPIIGKGSMQNLRDLLYLRGVDVGIVQMDAREALRAEKLYEEAVRKLRVIARLYNEEVHIVASRDISDIRELNGRKVNIDNPGSGTNTTARIVFEKLGIKPEYTTMDQATAFARLVSGEIQAAVYVAGRPVRIISEFAGDERFHLLQIPFAGGLEQTYFPVTLTATDYPRLVAVGTQVETIAVGNILVCFNWPRDTDRFDRLKKFVTELFSHADDFVKPGRHAKWKEVNLHAGVPCWQRFGPVEEWEREVGRKAPQTATGLAEVNAYMSSQLGPNWAVSEAERARLFEEFKSWRKGVVARQTGGR